MEALLGKESGLQAKTVFEWLQKQHPGKFQASHRRTLERRVRHWRVTCGPAREVMFRQVHHAGDLAASDFTEMNSLGVPIFQVHEPQPRRAFNRARIEQDRGHAGLALHLIQQHGHVVDARGHDRHPGQEGDVLGGVQVGQPLGQQVGQRSPVAVREIRGDLFLAERKSITQRLKRLVAIELPKAAMESVSPKDKDGIRARIEQAEKELDELREEFLDKGYPKAATYLANAKDRLFGHLRVWLDTGLVCPRATSLIENLIRELVRRLKKIGWNWSDSGAQRMGRIVMIRRYDPAAWEEYWERRMHLQGRCQIEFVGTSKVVYN